MEPSGPRRWRAEQRALFGMGFAGLVAVIILTRGNLRFGLALLALAVVGAGAVVLPMMYAERRRFHAAPPDVLLLVRSSVAVEGLRSSSSLSAALEDANLRALSRWNQNRASGWVTLTAGRLNWEPDGLSRRWNVKPFHLDRSEISAAELGHIGAKGAVEFRLTDGSTLDFRGTSPARWRTALTACGLL